MKNRTDEHGSRRRNRRRASGTAGTDCRRFLGSQKYVTDAFGTDLNPRTNVLTKPEEYETSVPGVFVAGDMHRGQSLVVWAIAEGRKAAEAVDRSLMGSSF